MKLKQLTSNGLTCPWFLLYSPLNQGLKRAGRIAVRHSQSQFLLYSPLNQGLKPISFPKRICASKVFTLQSIKSRIETTISDIFFMLSGMFLLYSPLNQGLKPSWVSLNITPTRVFTLQSIKSRIETNADVEMIWSVSLFLLYSPLNQGLKQNWISVFPDTGLCFYSTVH